MHKHNLLKSMHFQVWKDTKTTQMKSLLCKGKFKKKRKKSIKACYTYFTVISSNLRSRLNQLFLECFWTDWLEFSSLSQFTVLPAFFVWTQLQLCEWFPLLILVTFIPLLSSYAGLLLLFLASFPKDGGCSAVASSAQMEHLRAPWKDLIGLVAHFSFFLVSFPVFTELLFLKLSTLVVDSLAFVAPVEGAELKYITVTVTEQWFHCEILNQILHITQYTNKLSLSVGLLFREQPYQPPFPASLFSCSVHSAIGLHCWRICAWVCQKQY